ncbi:MAG: class I SAM-dependent methyltransferase [Candidatus Obscuribacterales bacterium]|nr:class I SAM-dependent methyltransferase [Candidatus Obscuribacterales bacterium]
MNAMTPEMAALKDRLKATWMAGDYGYFAKYLEAGAMEFLEELALKPGIEMLDVGCGAGQIAIPAARRGAKVTGIDLASNLIDQARERAQAVNLEIAFEQGDAETLPYNDASFDLVVSLIGAMFAPRPERVAAELMRVCRSGGRVVMANWTPGGFIGELFKTVGKHVAPPDIMPSPLKWGEEPTVRERLHKDIAELRCVKRNYPFWYPFGPKEVVEFYGTYYGPVNRAFGSLDEVAQESLRRDLEQLWTKHNTASDGTTQYHSEYLFVTAVKG